MDGLRMKYFVLKPKSKVAGDVYAEASRRAIKTYANYIKSFNKELADDLKGWVKVELEHDLSLPRLKF